MKRLLTATLVLLCTGGLLTYALWDVDLAALGELLASARYAMLAPFLVALTGFFWLKAWRWAMILAPLGRYRVREVTPAMMVGFAANNVLPAHLGELVRAVLFARRYRQGIAAVLVSQVLERLLDIAAVVALYLLAVAWVDEAPAVIRSSVWLVAVCAALGTAIVFALALAPGPMLATWRALARALPRWLRDKGDALLVSVVQALASVRSPLALLALLGNSVAQWTLMVVAVWLSLGAFGESVTPAVAAIVLAATVVAVTLPSAPGYVGAIQAAFVFALRPFGVSEEIAFAASVFFLVCQWIPVTALGALLFTAAGMASNEVRGAVREIEGGSARSTGC
ncbi:MAG: lysylphosphatidylglycerol synthase transmembrane domain-containing protein [Gammaproteobacteria bacterium]|nr:lysylphosphatidylglycerol synthase transmembrane domain-containing protein [Gammaproteobacteria bacterium]